MWRGRTIFLAMRATYPGRARTLIMSYIPGRAGKAPFVLTVDNAKAYFDPSTLITETRKTATTLLMKLPRMKKRFARFLEDHVDAQYLETHPQSGR
jgi:hypothetical protein